MKRWKLLKLILFSTIIFLMNISFVMAKESIEITKIEKQDQSDFLIAEDLSYENNTISSLIIFNKKNDYITLSVTLKNNTENDYQLSQIDNQLNNELLTVDYDKVLLPKNSEITIPVTIRHNNPLSTENQIEITNGLLSLNFKNLSNPLTSRTSVFLLVIIVIVGSILLKFHKKKELLLFLIFFMPVCVYALGNTVSIRFTNAIINKSAFRVTFKEDDDTVDSYLISLGDEIGTLPMAIKRGYEFTGWKDEDNNIIDETYVIGSDTIFVATFTPIEYTITYFLDDGILSSPNPETYTVEDSFTLINPTKENHIFVGWTENDSTTLQTEVSIPEGSIGNRTYTAHFEPKRYANYTIVYRKMNVEGEYEETSRETKQGEVGTSVTPEIPTYTGFIEPESQTKQIKEDGTTTFIYDYERLKFNWSFNINQATSTHEPGYYYYETEITITAHSISNSSIFGSMVFYQHGSSQEIHNRTYTFILTGDTSVQIYFCLSGEMEVEVYDKKKKKRMKKKLKDVGPDDLLLAWDFDNGCLDYVEPSFILHKEKAYEHHILRFDDGSELDVVGEHRMYDVDREMFVDCIADSPMGTRTFTKDGKIITLISRQKVETEVDVCRVITKKHFNFFANGILTSIVLNNLYPIQDMKYVKEERNAIHIEDLNVDEYTFNELRFSEVDENFKGYLESTQSFLNYYAGQLSKEKYDRNEKDDK